MVSAEEMLRNYGQKPFTLWELRGKQFTILENLPISGVIREVPEFNEKAKKNLPYYFIHIEDGLFHKDLKMSESELLALFVHAPKGLMNFCGAMFEVDRANKYGLKYIGTATQDINGNRLGTNTSMSTQSTPISQPQQPQDQKSLFMQKMIGSMRALESVGLSVDAAKLTKMCDAMSPGNALELIAAAKSQGLIVESQGIFKVIE